MSNRRAAIVAGCRTPFARSGTVFRDLTAVDLAKVCVRELLERTEVDPASIGTVVMGQVVPSVKAPNLGREVGPRGRAAEVGPRPHRQPRLRLREPGDRRRGLLDPARSRGRRDRRRGGEPLRRADPAQPAHGAHPGGDAEGEVVRRPPGLARAGAAARPRAGRAGHRRAVHRPDDGPVGREDGEGERRHARGAGPDRLRLAPQRLGRDPGRAPARRDLRGSRSSLLRDGRQRRQPAAQGHLDGGARLAAAGVRPALRHRDRRELLRAHGRRGRRPPDVRGEGEGRGLPSPGLRAQPGPWPRWTRAGSS